MLCLPLTPLLLMDPFDVTCKYVKGLHALSSSVLIERLNYFIIVLLFCYLLLLLIVGEFMARVECFLSSYSLGFSPPFSLVYCTLCALHLSSDSVYCMFYATYLAV